MKNRLFISIFIYFLSFNIYACRCIEPSHSKAFESSEVVVIGEVLETSSLTGNEGSIAIIKVNKTWKKQIKSKIGIFSITNCNFTMDKGKHYILFLKTEEYGLYSTGRCSGNKLVSSSDSDKLLKWLDIKKSYAIDNK